MRKIITAIFIILVLTGTSWALPMTGSLTGGNGLYGTGGWSDATFSWDITDNGNGTYTYSYTFSVERKAISHLIIQVSDNFTERNIFAETTAGWDLDIYSEGHSNPDMPGSFAGIKWDTIGEPSSFTVNIVTNRAPMWGNFYAKDGVDQQGTIDVVAWSGTVNGFGDNVVVPDTNTVPEPNVLMLLGAGLIGLVALKKKIF